MDDLTHGFKLYSAHTADPVQYECSCRPSTENSNRAKRAKSRRPIVAYLLHKLAPVLRFPLPA